MARDEILSRAVIEGMIADGNTIVIYENRMLRVDTWLPRHPGGDKVVFHMVGRDATDEINAYHSYERVLARKYQIGRVEGVWENFIPPIQRGQFRKLDQIDEAASLTEPSACGSQDDELCSTTATTRGKSTVCRIKSAPEDPKNGKKEIAGIIYAPTVLCHAG
ncbi:cytochrome b5-like heme/steroid binding domain-containing protein [Lipomyces starkeyi]